MQIEVSKYIIPCMEICIEYVILCQSHMHNRRINNMCTNHLVTLDALATPTMAPQSYTFLIVKLQRILFTLISYAQTYICCDAHSCCTLFDCWSVPCAGIAQVDATQALVGFPETGIDKVLKASLEAGESMIIFITAALALDYCLSRELLSPFPSKKSH